MLNRNRLVATAAFVAMAVLIFLGVAGAAAPKQPAVNATSGVASSCTTDGTGYCTVTHALGAIPSTVLLTPVIAAGATPYVLSAVAGQLTATTVKVRAIKVSNGSALANTGISFSMLVLGSASPPTTTTTPPVTTTTTPPITTTTTTTPPPPSGYPTAATTGVPTGTVLATVSGDMHVTTPGPVDAVHVTGSIFVEVSGVTITRSRIDQSVVNAASDTGGPTFSITDSDVGPSDCSNTGRDLPIGVGYNNYTALRVHLHGHEDGFRAGGPNITIKDSYVLICSPAATNDSDGVQDYPAAQHIVIDHNTLDMDHAQGFTAPISVHSDPANGGSSDVTITNNLLAGVHASTYTLNLWPMRDHGPWVVTGNRIVDGAWVFGAFNTETGRDANSGCPFVNTWADNDVVTTDADYQVTGTVQNDVACPA